MAQTKKPKLEAVEGEQSEFVEIPFEGTTFKVARNRDDWPTEGLAYLSETKYNLFVRATLEMAEPGQWDVLCRLCPRRRDFNEFFTVFGKTVNEECIG